MRPREPAARFLWSESSHGQVDLAMRRRRSWPGTKQKIVIRL
ncbi:uncharacterized protein PITG_05732 [Phytophthora infestans T30-4]|uniref:Uncharacterized protein n=1 Tax=Phytophthora infestans (strain T30-4) TaxID=403677 RepID=D0N5J8_PHYIT|nr:uncharacterized protein PITG_05732 [Phytophthora infestans T30-4]EEY70339.1 hypothetical protein PITG_05732 [Phytophthora infestans T30-4]|eukprot:XP_002997993.1 hypothetical protein PITG_05732 [Phytophthora infestans T30-4]